MDETRIIIRCLGLLREMKAIEPRLLLVTKEHQTPEFTDLLSKTVKVVLFLADAMEEDAWEELLDEMAVVTSLMDQIKLELETIGV